MIYLYVYYSILYLWVFVLWVFVSLCYVMSVYHKSQTGDYEQIIKVVELSFKKEMKIILIVDNNYLLKYFNLVQNLRDIICFQCQIAI